MATHNITIKRYNGSTWDTIYPKTTAANIISGELDPDRIPNLNANKITTGTINVSRIPNLNASKINDGIFDVARIPDLNANKITTGTLGVDRIPSLNASKINAGTFNAARIPELDAGKITTGKIDVNRLPAVALTNVQVSTTLAQFIATYQPGVMQEGDVLILTGDKKTYIHNGGETGTASDFTLLETPTDQVISVAGKKGVVTLVKGDVGLENVDNTSDMDKPVSTAQSEALTDIYNTLNEIKVEKNPAITGSTKTKITYDSKGLVTGGADLDPNDIPTLPASKISGGTFGASLIPSLAISKISGLQTALDGKQMKISLLTVEQLPTESAEGNIIFHTF